MTSAKKLTIIVIVLLIIFLLIGCTAVQPTTVYSSLRPDTVYSECYRDSITILANREELARLKKENKKLKYAVIVVAGLGWGFTILKLVGY